MPELIEVELYRQAAAHTVGRRVAAIMAPDQRFLKGGLDRALLEAALIGRRVIGTRRRGKVALVDFDLDVVVGLRFGMTGRLVVDGLAPIEYLEFGSRRDDPAWDRFALEFTDGSVMRVNDPRRLGSVELDPDLSSLGPDALDGRVGPVRLARIVDSERELKALLLDQSRIAGLGNLVVDEILFRVGLDPRRRGRSLADVEIRRLAAEIGATVRRLFARGGSHTGDLQSERTAQGRCPRDGAILRREPVGGRTTYWCPAHQR